MSAENECPPAGAYILIFLIITSLAAVWYSSNHHSFTYLEICEMYCVGQAKKVTLATQMRCLCDDRVPYDKYEPKNFDE